MSVYLAGDAIGDPIVEQADVTEYEFPGCDVRPALLAFGAPGQRNDARWVFSIPE